MIPLQRVTRSLLEGMTHDISAGRDDSRYQCWKGKTRPVIAGIGTTYPVTEWNGLIHLVFAEKDSLVQSLRERKDSPGLCRKGKTLLVIPGKERLT
jgi:hypothetical protein